MTQFICFVLLILLTQTYCALFDVDWYKFRVNRLEKCDEEDMFNISINFLNFRVIKQDGVHAKFHGRIEIKKTVQISFRLSIHGLRCDSPEDHVCGKHFNRQFGTICQKLDQNERSWYPFLQGKFSCPIPVGVYDIGNATIDINTLANLPLTEGIWVIKVYGYSASNVVMCLYSQLEIISLYNKKTNRRRNRRMRYHPKTNRIHK